MSSRTKRGSTPGPPPGRKRGRTVPSQIVDSTTTLTLGVTMATAQWPRESDPPGEDAAIQRLLERMLVPESARITVVSEVARGGMGSVELVIDRTLERRMARKVAHPHLRGSLPQVSGFLREAQIMAQLDHPSIVPIHQIGVDGEGRLHFTMKLVEGETFEALVGRLGGRERDSETTLELVEVVGKIADALAFAHSRGVVHGDVKPANVMVGSYGQVYLMDWGLARPNATRTPPTGPAVTTWIENPAEGMISGTPAFMSPEQARGEPADERADIFAVGALLYFALSLRAPFAAPTVSQSLSLARRGEHEPLLDAAPRDLVSPALARIGGASDGPRSRVALRLGLGAAQ